MELRPPVPHVGTQEVGEDAAARPDEARDVVDGGVAHERVEFQSGVEHLDPWLLLHTGVDDGDAPKSALAELGGQRGRIGKPFRVPREDLVVVHVLDVEMEHVARQPPAGELVGDAAQRGGRVVAPVRLVVAERPARRQLDPSEQCGEPFEHDGRLVAVDDDVVELAAGDSGDPGVRSWLGTDLAPAQRVEEEAVRHRRPMGGEDRHRAVYPVGLRPVLPGVDVPERLRRRRLVERRPLAEPGMALVRMPPFADLHPAVSPADRVVTVIGGDLDATLGDEADAASGPLDLDAQRSGIDDAAVAIIGAGALDTDPIERAEAAEPGVQIGEPDRGRQERLDAERPAVGVERSGNVNVQVGVTPPVIWRVSTMVIAIPALFNVGEGVARTSREGDRDDRPASTDRSITLRNGACPYRRRRRPTGISRFTMPNQSDRTRRSR